MAQKGCMLGDSPGSSTGIYDESFLFVLHTWCYCGELKVDVA